MIIVKLTNIVQEDHYLYVMIGDYDEIKQKYEQGPNVHEVSMSNCPIY